MADKLHYKIKVSGRVQGVYYRASTKAVADQLRISGWIKNLADGSVYIEAEGETFFMGQFLEWCEEGPSGARVEAIEKEAGELQGFSNFVIKK